jgi:uncharacterized protein (DUF1499 family)
MPRFLRFFRLGLMLMLSLGLLGVLGLAIAARRAPRPSNLGVADGRLAACPPFPNCVATDSTDPTQRMAAIPYTTTTALAKQRLLAIVNAQPRTTIIEETPTYLAVVYRSATFQFPDDVEFLFDEASQQILFRSASRIGKGDMGVNRARMEEIRRRFLEAAPNP